MASAAPTTTTATAAATATTSSSSSSSSSALTRICDPHFHYWDHDTRPNANLGDIVKTLPKYLPSDYKAHIGSLPFKAVVHLETVVGQEPGGFKLDTVDETKWVDGLFDSEPPVEAKAKCVIAPFLQLTSDEVETTLEALLKYKRVRGIRMILNQNPTWPQVGSDDVFTMKAFANGYALLAKHNLSYDMQINPHQLQAAATFFLEHPDVQVVLNHIGCLKLEPGKTADNDKAIAEWKEGMTAISAATNVHVKLSGISYTYSTWATDADGRALLKQLLQWVITTFGTKRCMFASNFPVTHFIGSVDLKTLYAFYEDCAATMTAEEKDDLFYATAARVYRIE